MGEEGARNAIHLRLFCGIILLIWMWTCIQAIEAFTKALELNEADEEAHDIYMNRGLAHSTLKQCTQVRGNSRTPAVALCLGVACQLIVSCAARLPVLF